MAQSRARATMQVAYMILLPKIGLWVKHLPKELHLALLQGWRPCLMIEIQDLKNLKSLEDFNLGLNFSF